MFKYRNYSKLNGNLDSNKRTWDKLNSCPIENWYSLVSGLLTTCSFQVYQQQEWRIFSTGQKWGSISGGREEGEEHSGPQILPRMLTIDGTLLSKFQNPLLHFIVSHSYGIRGTLAHGGRKHRACCQALLTHFSPLSCFTAFPFSKIKWMNKNNYKKRFIVVQTWALVKWPGPIICVVLGVIFNLSVSLFFHLQNGENESTFSVGGWGDLSIMRWFVYIYKSQQLILLVKKHSVYLNY